jgi:hypothetical protein
LSFTIILLIFSIGGLLALPLFDSTQFSYHLDDIYEEEALGKHSEKPLDYVYLVITIFLKIIFVLAFFLIGYLFPFGSSGDLWSLKYPDSAKNLIYLKTLSYFIRGLKLLLILKTFFSRIWVNFRFGY